ncbi:hypothetical protein CEUSTIGMA_g13657.t1, partial [Chlamydomonas eustigma]
MMRTESEPGLHDGIIASYEENTHAEEESCHSLVPISRETDVHTSEGLVTVVTKPLPKVLILHTGGTLGMDVESFEEAENIHVKLRHGVGSSSYAGGLKPGSMLGNLLQVVPELSKLANLDLQVVFNKDSCNVGPAEWIRIAHILDANRRKYDAFLVVHGTDTMAYTASALSLLLRGFKRPIILTGSQMPLSAPRSD